MQGYFKPIQLFSILLLTAVTTRLSAQQPVLKVTGKDSARVKLRNFKVDVKVVGTTAITTMEMEFCSNAARVLEGELTFPMPDGVSISRYALDINGKMREAVPVEKEKGQVVFENIERRNTDPGLLEKTEGNNFRTRIYPIPAGGCRRIIIGYEQPLTSTASNVLLYHLPMNFRQPIAAFGISFTVFSKAPPEVSASCSTNLAFRSEQAVYSAAVSQRNFKPEGSFTIQVPKWPDAAEVMVQERNGRYFFIATAYPQVTPEDKQIPDNIGIVWDASLSGLNRNHAKEFELLDSYFKKKQNALISLTLLGIDAQPGGQYTLSNGNWQALRQKLETLTYDGATDFGKLQQWPAAGEYLFFTDGLATYGNTENMVLPSVPVYTINASPNAAFPLLKYMAAKTGGSFINLAELPPANALDLLTRQQLLFLGIRPNNAISELYPSFATPAAGGCTAAGISSTASTSITLLFGYGGKVLQEKTIDLAAAAVKPIIDIEKIWAQKKIASLELLYEQNKAAITTLGKQYGLVTQNTSLIVLDAVEDYVKYEIAPPAELKAAYTTLLKQQQAKELRKQQRSVTEAAIFYNKLTSWWNRDFTERRQPANKPKLEVQQLTAANTVIANQVSAPGLRDEYHISHAPSNFLAATDSAVGYRTGSSNLQATIVQLDTVRFAAGNYSAAAAALQPNTYGWSATESGGYVRVTTADGTIRTITRSDAEQVNSLNSGNASEPLYDSAGKISTADIDTDNPWTKQLDSAADGNLYSRYIELRPAYIDNPVYYFDVAKKLFAAGDTATGLKVLSAVADLNFDDHELYKMLGYQLKVLHQYAEAVNVFRKVLQWRPQEPQSYRDYGLALADAGSYQQALDTLYYSLTKNFDEEISSLYPGIEEVIVTEINNLIARHGSQLNTSKIDKRILRNLPCDVRVVLNWNMNDTDIDLWVFDPNGEQCYYANNLTDIGGRISADFTRGYGPEQFMLKKAPKGSYKVMLNYYGDSQQKIAGPTTVMAEIFTNYGKPGQQSKTIALQMEKSRSGEVLVATFDF